MHITCEHNARYDYNRNDVEVLIYNSKSQHPTIIYEDDFLFKMMKKTLNPHSTYLKQ